LFPFFDHRHRSCFFLGRLGSLWFVVLRLVFIIRSKELRWELWTGNQGRTEEGKLLRGVDTLIADRRSHTQTNPIQRSCPSRLVHKLHIKANYDSRRPFVWETDNDTLKTRRSRRSRQSRISPSCTRLLF